jgi:hypothetical protein
MRVRQRAHKDCVDQAENRSGRADAEGEGKERDGGEAGILAELPNAVAVIGDHGVEAIASPFFANLFFQLFDTTSFGPRGTLRFFPHYVQMNFLLCERLEMGLNLLGRGLSPHDETKRDFAETSHKERHPGYLSTKKSRPPAKARFGSTCERIFGTAS